MARAMAGVSAAVQAAYVGAGDRPLTNKQVYKVVAKQLELDLSAFETPREGGERGFSVPALHSDTDQAIEKYFESVEGEYVEYSEVDFAVDLDAAMMRAHVKLLRDALARVLGHADSELEQRQTSGNGEEFLKLERDFENAHEALRLTAIYEPASPPTDAASKLGEVCSPRTRCCS